MSRGQLLKKVDNLQGTSILIIWTLSWLICSISKTENDGDDYGDDGDCGSGEGSGDGDNLAPRVRLMLKETSWEGAGEPVRPSGEVFLVIFALTTLRCSLTSRSWYSHWQYWWGWWGQCSLLTAMSICKRKHFWGEWGDRSRIWSSEWYSKLAQVRHDI